jgi:hypothetical protein
MWRFYFEKTMRNPNSLIFVTSGCGLIIRKVEKSIFMYYLKAFIYLHVTL